MTTHWASPSTSCEPHKQLLLNLRATLRDLAQALTASMDRSTLYTRERFANDSEPDPASQVPQTVIAIIKAKYDGNRTT